MTCPDCGSNNTVEQKYKEAETEEIEGVYVKVLVILCKDCGWGFNITGTIDRRSKPPV